MTIKHHYPPAPPLVQAEKAEKQVSLATLSQGQKQQIWNGIKKTTPALAQVLQSDDINALKEAFDARIIMETKEAERYFKAGEKNEKALLCR